MVNKRKSWGDRYDLVVMGSTRQLVVGKPEQALAAGGGELDESRRLPSTPETSSGQAVRRPLLTSTLYGGIRYDMDSTAIASAARGQDDLTANDDQLSFSYLDRAAPERGRSWHYLPATAVEADKISQIIQAQGGQAQAYTGYAATEASFKQIGREGLSPSIIHLATHGYFFPDPEEEAKTSSRFNELPAFKISDHPMIRSGLVMAGGNHAWRGEKKLDGMEDGILTAYEISQVNLGNTDLTVLSACETGLGDIDGNEGVYGLQRAFKIAGVKNIIMSLWNVPDEQTQEMMVAFYDHWLNRSMDIADAFRMAQREMQEKHKEHYYWAAFVLIE